LTSTNKTVEADETGSREIEKWTVSGGKGEMHLKAMHEARSVYLITYRMSRPRVSNPDRKEKQEKVKKTRIAGSLLITINAQ
jgi:hypothetical protein